MANGEPIAVNDLDVESIFAEKALRLGQRDIGLVLQSVSLCEQGKLDQALTAALEGMLEFAKTRPEEKIENDSRGGHLLDSAVGSIFRVYELTGGATAIDTVETELLDEIRQEMVGNHFVQEYLLVKLFHGIKVFDIRDQGINLTCFRDILDLFIAAPRPIDPKVNAEIVATVGKIARDVTAIPYPENYVVNARWRAISDQSLMVASKLDNAYHIVLYGMYFAQFGMQPLLLQGKNSLRNMVEKGPTSRLLNDYPNLEESAYAFPGSMAVHDGRNYTADFLTKLSYYDQIVSPIGSEDAVKTVLEIGSGYGTVARTFKLIDPERRYILVDLPESLAFSYAYLKLNFPDKKFRFITEPCATSDRFEQGIEFIFCPVQLFDQVEWSGIDLVINMWSFGEMPQGCVDYFLKVINRMDCRYLYSLNLMFQDKNLLCETSGDTNEGNQIVNDVNSTWRPRHLSLASSVGIRDDITNAEIYRNFAHLLVERTDPDADASKGAAEAEAAAERFEFASWDWVTWMYFAALWSDNPATIERFLDGLEQFLSTTKGGQHKSFVFENIGEVQHLRNRLADLAQAGNA